MKTQPGKQLNSLEFQTKFGEAFIIDFEQDNCLLKCKIEDTKDLQFTNMSLCIFCLKH